MKDPQETGHYQRLSGASVSDHHWYGPVTGSVSLPPLLKTGILLTSHQLNAGLESLVRCAARVVDLVAQCDVGKELAVPVDLLNGEDHGLHPAERAKVKPEMMQRRNFCSFQHQLGIGDK